jgi:hypothetical protein
MIACVKSNSNVLQVHNLNMSRIRQQCMRLCTIWASRFVLALNRTHVCVHLGLSNDPFLGIRLSATHLVYLRLYYITRNGYIPPEEMATSLSALTSLEFLQLHFQYTRRRPALESRRPPPLTRSDLSSSTRQRAYNVTFFNQITFDTPQVFHLISPRPTLRAPGKGHVAFNFKAITV